MSVKIKIRLLSHMCIPTISAKGDWIDLKAAKTLTLKGLEATTLKRPTKDGVRDSFREINNNYQLIPLGVAIQLPKGYEAIIAPRSSTFKYYKSISANSIGIIDNSYCGNEDQWYLPIIPFSNITIEEGERVCQFRIQLSQKATIWQKIKWLFSNGIELEYVEQLNNINRQGIGSTGKK